MSRTVEGPDKKQRKYAIFVPPQYEIDENHRWPVILFLHGSGELGVDGIKQTTIGMPVYVARNAARFPFIVIMPQAHQMWFRGQEAAALWAMLEDVHASFRTDRDRVYLTGLSMGGFAAWELAVMRPDVFAAVAPVCGVAPKPFLKNIVDLPVWAFHGGLDRNVPVSGSREAVEELKRLGASPRYTEYPNLAHNCWDEAYENPELYRWFLQYRRKTSPKVIDYTLPATASRVWWLAVEAATGQKQPAHVRAEVGDDGRVNITSEGVVGWALVSNSEPLVPGSEIDVTWNGRPVYKGAFDGVISVEPAAASRREPAKSPKR